jgi:hypothetical protein
MFTMKGTGSVCALANIPGAEEILSLPIATPDMRQTQMIISAGKNLFPMIWLNIIGLLVLFHI